MAFNILYYKLFIVSVVRQLEYCPNDRGWIVCGLCMDCLVSPVCSSRSAMEDLFVYSGMSESDIVIMVYQLAMVYLYGDIYLCTGNLAGI